jgi:hypothetical protein
MNTRFAAALLALAMTATSARAEDCQMKLYASLDVVESDGGLIVPVTLQGQPGGYMTLDLDGIVSGVTEDLAKRFDLHRQAISQDVTIYIDNQRIFQKGELSIQLGGSRGDSWVGILPKYSTSDPRVIGILAMDVLNQFDLEFDFAHHKLNLFSPDHCKGQVIYWTKTAPVAAVPMTLRGDAEFVIPMQLDGKDLNAELSTGDTASLNGKIAHDDFGLENAKGTHTFKMISVDGLGITNPTLAVYPDESSGCNGGASQAANSLLTERDPIMERCYGHPDLVIGLQQLKHLRVYVAYKERMLYATSASAN